MRHIQHISGKHNTLRITAGLGNAIWVESGLTSLYYNMVINSLVPSLFCQTQIQHDPSIHLYLIQHYHCRSGYRHVCGVRSNLSLLQHGYSMVPLLFLRVVPASIALGLV